MIDLEYRFNGNSNIGFFNRLYNYPTFAILIFDEKSEYISDEEKEEFKEKILTPYLTDEFFRLSMKGKYIAFIDGKFCGAFIRNKIPNGRYRRIFSVDYPYEDKTYINTKNLWWRKF